MQFRSWAASHPGAVRKYNEDTFVDRPEVGLWAVADGAGGHEAGEVASAMIKRALEDIPVGLSASEMLAQVRLRLQATHEALREEAARRGPRAMIVSTVAVLLARDGHFACLWAGDSRIYLLREGQLQQVTRDHSLVQEMVDAGALRPEEAEGHPRSNVITRAVGVETEALELEKFTSRAFGGDRFLLCSDGLFKALTADQVGTLLRADAADTPADRLISAALAVHASDNVTAVAVEARG